MRCVELLKINLVEILNFVYYHKILWGITSMKYLVRLIRFLISIPVVIFFIIEGCLRYAANWLQTHIPYVRFIQLSREWIARQPYYIVLPMFLVPEILSHVAGFFSAILMVHGQFMLSIAVFTIFKGFFTICLVWIYNSAEQTLLGVHWFAYVHEKIGQVRKWALNKIEPYRAWCRELVLPKYLYVKKWCRVRFMQIRNKWKKLNA